MCWSLKGLLALGLRPGRVSSATHTIIFLLLFLEEGCFLQSVQKSMIYLMSSLKCISESLTVNLFALLCIFFSLDFFF